MTDIEGKREEIREGLAKLEHDQWVEWSKAVAPEVSPERQERWKKLWIPYSELTEEQKDQDRVWADKSIANLDSQGVVIKVDRESGYEYMCGARIKDILKRGYVAVEPLIDLTDERL